ncbi:MAG TPA: ABC transporter substrate-binding protein [Actinomycetes bacterium]|jgi:ABC-type branched-subunit amino acid transport system substrate-binding protein|nr:ABC transporter substrate-binding protein [Actinomycetes bacterium]
MNTSPPITAALTLSLTGPFERQGTEAAEGMRLWAEAAGVRLMLADDRGSKDLAVQAYAAWLDGDRPDLLLGPYASGLVRAVVPVVRGAGRLLWNHGGSADDLARPGVVCLPAPASSYFEGVVDQAVARQVDRLVVVQGAGPFARAVAGGALARASARGLEARTVDAAAVDAEAAARTGTAVLVVGRFEQDVAVVRRLSGRWRAPALLAAVAAGIAAFGQELGEAAEGVLGPVQWWPSARTPEVGPSGIDFAADYQRRTGQEPSYPAAQAAAAGYLGHAAHRLGVAAEDMPRWATSTLLGEFALDAAWRQVGHRVTTVRWQGGRMVPIAEC